MQQLEDADLEDSSQTTCTICLHSVYLGVDGSGNLSNESLQKLSMNCKQKCINMFKREQPEAVEEVELPQASESSENKQEIWIADEFVQTPCNHNFHEVCLKKWLEVQRKCPVCRDELPFFVDDD